MDKLAVNMGTLDRGLRAAFGILLLSLTVIGPRSRWGLLGLLPLTAAASGRCVLYSAFGVDTLGRRRALLH